MEPTPADRPRARSAWARALAQWWYGPISAPETWRAAGYLAVGTATSAAAFVVVGFVVVGIGLIAWTVAGLAAVIPGCAVVGWWSTAERRRAHLVGEHIDARPVAADAGRGIAARVRTRLADPARWRQVAYHLTGLVVTWTLAAVALAAWAAVLYLVTLPAWGWAVGLSLPESFVLALIGVALGGLPARIVVGTARLGVAYTRWLLGPDRVALMQSQVEMLTADRRQIIDAVAAERRRIERNLHDGVQARLVSVGIDLGLAEQLLAERPEDARALLASARAKNRTSISELREIGRGLHPAVLEDRGLDAALSALVAGAPIPIHVHCELAGPVPPAVEEAAYFVVSEAIGNVLKHSRARSASVDVESDTRRVRMVVRDDGIGGARTGRGTGLDGIDARVRALDGRLQITSPVGGPTVVDVELPIVVRSPRGAST